jgi:hypothetical protein
LEVISSQIEARLAEIIGSNQDDKALKTGIELVLKLANNVVDKPTEAKFRTVNTVNKRIAADVFTLQGDVSELFCLMGYTKQGDTLVYEGNNFRVLRRGIKLTEDAIEPTQCKFMTKEELTKHQILQASKKAYAEKLKKDKERVAEAERKHA